MTPEQASSKLNGNLVKESLDTVIKNRKPRRRVKIDSIEQVAKEDKSFPLIFIFISIICLLIIFHIWRVGEASESSYMTGYQAGIDYEKHIQGL